MAARSTERIATKLAAVPAARFDGNTLFRALAV
jgi:hypothetical protein